MGRKSFFATLFGGFQEADHNILAKHRITNGLSADLRRDRPRRSLLSWRRVLQRPSLRSSIDPSPSQLGPMIARRRSRPQARVDPLGDVAHALSLAQPTVWRCDRQVVDVPRDSGPIGRGDRRILHRRRIARIFKELANPYKIAPGLEVYIGPIGQQKHFPKGKNYEIPTRDRHNFNYISCHQCRGSYAEVSNI